MKGITGLAMLAIVVCGLGVVQAQAPVTDFTYLGVFVVDYQGAEHYLRFFNDATGFMKADATAIDTEAHLSGSIGWNNGEDTMSGTWVSENGNIGDFNLRRETANSFTGTVKFPHLAPRLFNGRKV